MNQLDEFDVLECIPHRPPMLLVDRVLQQTEDSIICEKTFHQQEFFFQGHYPGHPICPGVILVECAVQAGAVLLSGQGFNDKSVPVLTKLEQVRFKRIVRPGETILMKVRLDERLSKAFYLSAEVVCNDQTVTRFRFVCTTAAVDSTLS